MFSSAIVPLAFAASALANVFLTSPVSSTTFTAGQQATVSWIDDGNSPSLSQFGNASFAIYVGNAIVQTPLQTIAASADVSSLTSLVFTPLASIGPNSDEYFIRVTSLSLKNPSSPQYYEEAFSAKFTLTGMSGTFNSTIQAEIDGQSTAPIGVPTASGSVSATGSTVATTTSAPSSSATSTSSNGAGKPIIASGSVALVAALIGASLL